MHAHMHADMHADIDNAAELPPWERSARIFEPAVGLSRARRP